jgi:Domain of unknown function (DUF4276)
MKRIIIVNEGQTEQEFCKDLLSPHFLRQNILINYPTIKKTGGGIVAWETLKQQIETHLKQDPTAFVTTLIDYYGINGKLKFPKWEEAKEIVDKNDRMSFLEEAMKALIDPKLSHRFIPYIQLHEFEGLLFCNIDVFKTQIAPNEFRDFNELIKTIQDNPNPELINEGKTTAPSKRLESYIKGYNKPVYGSILAEAIGLSHIRSKCPRFNHWISILESV